MNVNAMMSLIGNQSVKMTEIGQAMTSQTTAQNTNGFLDLIQSLMNKDTEMIPMSQTTSQTILLDDGVDNESMLDQLLVFMQMAEQKPKEVSAALLAFLKQSKDVDASKIDASWLQRVVQLGMPMIAQAVGSHENTDVAVSSNPLLANDVLLAIAKHAPDSEMNSEGIVRLEQALLELGMDRTQVSEFSKQVAMMTSQVTTDVGAASDATNGHTYRINGSHVVLTGKESLVKIAGMESISATSDPKMVMESMRFVRPALVEVNQEELKVLQMTDRKEELKPVNAEEVVIAATVPMATKHVGNEVIPDDSQALKQSVMNQVEQAVIRAIEKPSEEFVMKLRPEGLGEITVKMVMNEGGKIVLNIQTQSQEVRSLVSQELNQLRSTLVPLNVEVGEVSSYVSNEGFFQQSAYEQSRQQYQPEMQQKTKYSHEFFNQEELVDEVVVRRQMTGRLSRYV